ncbi:unnamed protein product [Hymenolepis diminuta]|uniref:PH domain-containing protein n=1 Tax=Hymenolepis diminuta TaxID=6216 RepID=A0A0R3SDR0_HYMDI|nr:unnamed protein product [Hymenolepis diminuta]
MEELIYMECEEACLNASYGPGYQDFTENSSLKEDLKLEIVSNPTEEERGDIWKMETKTNTPIKTVIGRKLDYIRSDLSTRYVKLRNTNSKISKRIIGDKASNKTDSLVMHRSCTKGASNEKSDNLENQDSHKQTQEAKTETKFEVKLMPKPKVKPRVLSGIPSFASSIQIFKKNPKPSNPKMNNYDVESDTESIYHAKENTESSPSLIRNVISMSMNKMEENTSSKFNKPQYESTEQTETDTTKELEPIGKDIERQPDEIHVIPSTEAGCSSTVSPPSDKNFPFKGTSAAKLADFFKHMSNVMASVTSFFTKLKKINPESIKNNDYGGINNVGQPPEDTYELYEDVQTLDAHVSQSTNIKKKNQLPSLRRSITFWKFNPRIPPLRIDKDQIFAKISKSFQKQGRKEKEKTSTPKEASGTSNEISTQSRTYQPKKTLLPLIVEKTKPDLIEYEYDEFPSAQNDSHDGDIYENFVGDSISAPKSALPKHPDENLYYNNDVIESANKMVLGGPPPLPPKKNKLTLSDKVSKERFNVQKKQKIRNGQRDFELPRRSVFQEKGGVKGLMKIPKKIVFNKPFSNSNKKGENNISHSKVHLKMKEESLEEGCIDIDNGDVYEQERPITLLIDFQDSNENEYELYGKISTNHQGETIYSEPINVNENHPENFILQRILPEIPRPNIESASEHKRNVRCSFVKTPKSKIINSQRDSRTNIQLDYRFNGSQDNQYRKEQDSSGNLKAPSTEKPNEVAEKIIPKKIPPVIPARPKYIPNHIISRLSTPVAIDTQNRSTRSSVLGKERSSDEQKIDEIPRNYEPSIDLQEESNVSKETSTQNGNELSAEVCQNDVYMYISDCYS